MANTVEIIIKAVDQASGPMSKATTGLDKFKAGFKSLTGFSLTAAGGIAAAGMAIEKVIAFTKQAVTETVDYVTQVKDMSRVLGLSTEDTSRLVQASDDLFISQDKLKTALLAASRQGIDVSIEGLKGLSEQDLSLPEGVERAQFLMQTFGRSGADMGKMMEIGAAGIDSAMASIQNSLVVTKSSVINIENYKRTVDNLSDSWMGFKMTVGNAVVPQLDLLFRSFTKGTDNVEDYYHKVNEIKNKISKLSGPAALGSKAAQDEIAKLRQELILLEDAFYGTGEGAGDAGESIEEVTLKFFSMRDAMKGVAEATGAVARSITQMDDIDPSFGDKIAGELQKIKFASIGGTELQGLHDQIIAQFNIGDLDAELATTLLEGITIANAALSVKAGEMTSNQAKEVIKSTLGVTYAEAGKMLQDFINNYDGKVINMELVRTYSSYGGSLGEAEIALQRDLNGNGIIGKAGGGPVWGGTPYVVGEKGPELFMPNQSGKIIPNDKLGGSNVTFYGDAYFAVDREITAQDIMKQMRVEA
jgi:hypothetical protein